MPQTQIYIEPNYRWAKLRAIKLMFRWSKMKIAQQVPERGQSYSIITGWRITNKRWSVCSLGEYPFAWSLIARQSLVKCPQCPFVTDNWPLILRYLSNWGQLGQVGSSAHRADRPKLCTLLVSISAFIWSRSTGDHRTHATNLEKDLCLGRTRAADLGECAREVVVRRSDRYTQPQWSTCL